MVKSVDSTEYIETEKRTVGVKGGDVGEMGRCWSEYKVTVM